MLSAGVIQVMLEEDLFALGRINFIVVIAAAATIVSIVFSSNYMLGTGKGNIVRLCTINYSIAIVANSTEILTGLIIWQQPSKWIISC